MNIGGIISSARKALGMTQEQLAQEVNVSRQTISNWENDRAEPDLTAIRKLDEVLGCNLLHAHDAVQEETSAQEEIPVPVDISALVEAVEKSPAEPARKWAWLTPKYAFIAGFVLAALIVTLVVSLRPSGTVSTAGMDEPAAKTTSEETVSSYLREDFQNPADAPVLVQAAQDPVLPTGSAENPEWFYEFTLSAADSGSYTMQKLTIINFAPDGTQYPMDYPAETISAWWGTTVLTKDTPQTIIGGFPVQALDGIGLILTCENESGETFDSLGYASLAQAE